MPDDKKAHKASAATLAHIDELLDEALEQTFPASDPIAINIERASDEPRDAKAPTIRKLTMMVSSALTGGGSLQMRAHLVVRPKAGKVPANDRLRPDNRNRAKD
jgi:hypothetical protein